MELVGNPLRQFQNQNASGVVALTGASPQTGVGKDVADATAGVALHRIQPGTLSASVELNIKATSLTMTAFWQVSADGSTWVQLVDANNAAQVALATGSGSDVDFGPVHVQAPMGVYAFPHARLAVVTGGSATGVAGHDNIKNIKYSYALKDRISE